MYLAKLHEILSIVNKTKQIYKLNKLFTKKQKQEKKIKIWIWHFLKLIATIPIYRTLTEPIVNFTEPFLVEPIVKVGPLKLFSTIFTMEYWNFETCISKSTPFPSAGFHFSKNISTPVQDQLVRIKKIVKEHYHPGILGLPSRIYSLISQTAP